MALLEGLARIDWSQLHHAYGPATDVPDLLRALAFPSPTSPLEKVSQTLWGNVFHQGTVWGASAAVVPFLGELLEAPQVAPPTKSFILVYLHHLAAGYPHDRFPTKVPIDELEAEAAKTSDLPASMKAGDAFAENQADHEGLGSLGAFWMRNCYRAVERELPSVYALCGDPVLGGPALALVAEFQTQAAASAAPLWQQVRNTELAALRRAQALLALSQLEPKRVPDMARVLLDSVDDLAAVYAAAAEVFSTPHPSPRSVELMLTPQEGAARSDCPFAGTVAELHNRAIRALPPSLRSAALPALAVTLRQATGFGKMGAVQSILEVAAVRGAPVTPLARQAIELLCEDADWGEYLNIDQSSLLRSYGLPDTQAGLRAMLSTEP